MAKTVRQRVVQVLGAISLVVIGGGIVVSLVFAGVMTLYWEPRHRPIAIVPSAKGGSVEIDGAAACTAIPAYTDEKSLRPCQAVLTPGSHVIEIKDPAGGSVHRDDVTIARGESTYLYAPELPMGQCLEMFTYQFLETTLPLSVSGPTHRPVATGFVDMEKPDYLFVEPPKKISSQEKDATRTALRMVPCAP